VFCSNGDEALQAVKSQQFDLVFMDVHMPFTDGLEATRRIRKWEDGGSRVPIVGLTAIFDSEHKTCFQAGMDDVISKPFDTAQMYQAIAVCLKDEGDSPQLDFRPAPVVELPPDEQAPSNASAGPGAYLELLASSWSPIKYDELISDFSSARWEAFPIMLNLKGLSATAGCNSGAFSA
jgi:CheY-like chemotaxis protein